MIFSLIFNVFKQKNSLSIPITNKEFSQSALYPIVTTKGSDNDALVNRNLLNPNPIYLENGMTINFIYSS